MTEIERQLEAFERLAVRAQRAGDTEALARLQDDYASTGIIYRGSQQPVRLVESSARRLTRSAADDKPVEVLLTRKAAESIRHNASWQTGQDGLETGGGLFGISTPERVLIVRATVIGPEATRGPDSLTMDTSVLNDWLLDDQVSRVGCWHTHPVTDDGGLSPTDVKAMRSGFSLINRSRFEPNYVDLILTRDGPRWGWARAKIHAHVISAKDGEPERATVTEL